MGIEEHNQGVDIFLVHGGDLLVGRIKVLRNRYCCSNYTGRKGIRIEEMINEIESMNTKYISLTL